MDTIAHLSNSNTQETEEGESKVLGQPGPHYKFKVNLSYIGRPRVKKKKIVLKTQPSNRMLVSLVESSEFCLQHYKKYINPYTGKYF